MLATFAIFRNVNPREFLPGTVRASDRFVRAHFYINAVTQSADPRIAAVSVFSVIRQTSVPWEISVADAPNLSTTRAATPRGRRVPAAQPGGLEQGCASRDPGRGGQRSQRVGRSERRVYCLQPCHFAAVRTHRPEGLPDDLEGLRVLRVLYPGLASHPGHAVAAEQMSGFGGMLTIELDGDTAAASAVVDRLQLFAIAPSLGGVASLATQPVTNP